MKSKPTTKDSAASAPCFHAVKLPLENVVVVGAGGNGSIFLTHLCRIHHAWTKLGGKPFRIVIYDPDRVSPANLGRQVFCEADVGLPKARVLAERIKAFFGISISYHQDKFRSYAAEGTVVVGCTDNLAARRDMRIASKPRVQPRTGNNHPGYRSDGCYWLDLGNGSDSGQVVLGGHGLPDFFDVFPKQLKGKDPKDLPSCSMAESLSRQDLFINSTVATYAAQLLWRMMKTGRLEHHGYFVNLQTGRTSPMPISAHQTL